MKFLRGNELSREIQRICRTRATIKCAVAYWGKDALRLTGLRPQQRNVKLICCLDGGASDPDVIGKFGSRARQNDFLHAKVIWTRDKAIVSSANISSNGMPDEEQYAKGLIEAGILVIDPAVLEEISDWFDVQYKAARVINAGDLKKAAEARSAKLWGKRKIIRNLVDALKDGGAQEFKQQRISFALWTDYASRAENSEARRHLKESTEKIEDSLKIDRRKFKRLDWFSSWSDLPTNTFLISCRYNKGRFTSIYLCKTFDARKNWPIVADGERTNVTFVLRFGIEGFNYRLSAQDRRVINSSAKALWRIAKGSNSGRILKMSDAAPVLLRHAAHA